MLAILLAASLLQPGEIARDPYGVPLIRVTTTGLKGIEDVYFLAGKAVAQDRMWQMEVSRRVARGRLAEINGASAAASDREVIKTGYTDDELQKQIESMSQKARTAFAAYARGVNAWIDEAKSSGTLPTGYSTSGISPEPWTPLDSAAIAVRMTRLFGRSGGGELRNYLLYLYLKGQPCKDKALDVVDDLAWQNDPASIPTVSAKDDPLATNHVTFPTFDRSTTEAHLKILPPSNVFELMPALQLAENETSKKVAMANSVPFKTGSYAIVVGPERSATGYPLLLSGPQMGHTIPSIVHQMSISTGDFKVSGLDTPGVPGVVVGMTPTGAWGLTTGVADGDDVVFYPVAGQDGYKYGTETRQLDMFHRSIKVQGAQDQDVVVKRTIDGPVLLESKQGKAIYALRSSLWMNELRALDLVFELEDGFDTAEIDRVIPGITANFNFFFATTKGEFGYRYMGRIPVRVPGYDPRFPIPGGPATEWKGFIPASQMPHVTNPKSGLLANWNNKPVSWWPNLDTPVWGAIFRNEMLLGHLSAPKLTEADLELAIWKIARQDTATNLAFLPLIKSAIVSVAFDSVTERSAARELLGFGGWMVDGSAAASIYTATISALREELYFGSTGNFVSPENAGQILQASPMLKALIGKSKFDYLKGRKRETVLISAFKKAVKRLADQRGPDASSWMYTAGSYEAPDQPRIPYSNRGTFIQIVRLATSGATGRNVISPGVAETGPHSADQAPLARAWMYKPVRW